MRIFLSLGMDGALLSLPGWHCSESGEHREAPGSSMSLKVEGIGPKEDGASQVLNSEIKLLVLRI